MLEVWYDMPGAGWMAQLTRLGCSPGQGAWSWLRPHRLVMPLAVGLSCGKSKGTLFSLLASLSQT